MSEENQKEELPLGLYWKGKRTTVDRTVLPFQSLEVVETINESRATREAEKGTMFREPNAEYLSTKEVGWRNKLIWGDNKYAMSALLEKYAGKIDLIYIDPPFATGANFSTKVKIGDVKKQLEHTKEASAIEELAYRDTWGKGLDSFLQMMYDRLSLLRELLSDSGSIYVHVDYRVDSFLRLLLDEIFGSDCLQNKIAYGYRSQGVGKKRWARKHDTILFYSKRADNFKFKAMQERIYYEKEFFGVQVDENGKYYSDVYLRDIWDHDDTRPLISGANEYLNYMTVRLHNSNCTKVLQ